MSVQPAAATVPTRVLVNDFIGGVLDRGIPLYVRNLVRGLEDEGLRVTVVRAPAIFRALPRNLFYPCSVLFEQIVVPIVATFLRADVVIYPYNSIAIADILSRRGRIVVHDLEIMDRRTLSPSRLYVSACYRVLRGVGYPVFTIANLIQKKIRDLALFGSAPIRLLPNTFYEYEDLLRAQGPVAPRPRSVLLCTGSTENKDLKTVIADYLPPLLAAGFEVSILGLHKKTDAERLAPLDEFIRTGQLKLCGQLSDAAVARAYLSHEIVWVHSLREGFGRCVVEGRLAQRHVVCTDIPEFSALKDDDVTLYRTPAAFMAAIAQRSGTAADPSYTGYPYRQMLHDTVRAGL